MTVVSFLQYTGDCFPHCFVALSVVSGKSRTCSPRPFSPLLPTPFPLFFLPPPPFKLTCPFFLAHLRLNFILCILTGYRVPSGVCFYLSFGIKSQLPMQIFLSFPLGISWLVTWFSALYAVFLCSFALVFWGAYCMPRTKLEYLNCFSVLHMEWIPP